MKKKKHGKTITINVEQQHARSKSDIKREILQSVWPLGSPKLIDTIIEEIPELQGTCEWPTDLGNVFYTFTISSIGIKCFKELLKRRRIVLVHADVYQCMYEDCFSDYPIAHRDRKDAYVKPRWQPAIVVILAMGVDMIY